MFYHHQERQLKQVSYDLE